MRLVTDPSGVESIYAEAYEHRVCLANFCTANPYKTQAILRAAWEFGCEHGLSSVPIIVSATANYPIESQLVSYTTRGSARGHSSRMLSCRYHMGARTTACG